MQAFPKQQLRPKKEFRRSRSQVSSNVTIPQRRATSSLRSGRPYILNERDIRHILRILKIDPFIKNDELLQQIGLTYGIAAQRHQMTVTHASCVTDPPGATKS